MFYEASIDTLTQKQNHLDPKSKIDLGSLSNVLIGLNQQALSFRRDAKDLDYPNKFYEDLLMPEERRQGNLGISEEEQMMQKFKANNVLMERTYLNGWQTFIRHSNSMVGLIGELLEKNQKDLEGQLIALRALSACKHEAKDLRDKIVSNLVQNNHKFSQQAIVDGFVGSA